jgi:DNA-binding transcriptional regulator YiaG
MPSAAEKLLPTLDSSVILGRFNMTPTLRPRLTKVVVRRDTRGSKIKALRERCAGSQYAFAVRLGVTPMTVSRWERDIVEPPADAYIKLARLTQDDDALYFLSCAGVTLDDIEKWWSDSASKRLVRKR